ncbi:glycosyltransferase family 61 protein [Roseovarius autotrophicus]|uniref:glycosyltransferase family 61 protein n=1 Tax=Roseovarius autotrophicus TaxID=2824121 RepID=UPI001B389A1B|nr:glycosyltransferase family 61 protein [Roseovarius autotrophicus]
MAPDTRHLPKAHIETVARAVVMPMRTGNHACGVLGPDGAPVPMARTLLSGSRFTPDPAPPEAPPARLAGRWLLGGVGRHHFGHFLLEATPRLWALDHLDARPDGILLLPMAGRDIAAVLRRRLGPLMDLLGQGLPVHLVAEPTEVETLILPSQGFGHLHWTHGTPEARTYMRRHLSAIAPDGPARLYISRRRLKSAAQQVPHEGRIEKWLSRAGFAIFHPERHSIPEQIAAYRAARMLLGPDGSAFHLAPFVAHPETRIGLIQRRTRQPVFDAILRQIEGFAGITPWISTALASAAPDNREGTLPPELHQLRADLHNGGFL